MKKIIMFFIFTISFFSFGKDLEVLTFSYPPYMGESSLSKEGLLVDIVNAAFAEVGVNAKTTFLPPKRSISQITTNESLAYIGVLKTFSPEAQEKLDVYPLTNLRFMIFYLNKRFPNGFSFKQYSDLKPYSIGVLSGVTEVVGRANNLKVEPANDLNFVFKKIEGLRNDIGVSVDLSIKIMLEDLFKEKANNFTVYNEKPFFTTVSTLLLNKEHPDYDEYAPKFRKGLKIIVENGKWLEILEHYYGKGNVPQESIDLVNKVIKDF